MLKQGCRQEVLEKTRGGASVFTGTATYATPDRQEKVWLHQEAERERESAMHRGKVLASSTEVGISMPHLGTWRLFGAGRGRGRELI